MPGKQLPRLAPPSPPRPIPGLRVPGGWQQQSRDTGARAQSQWATAAAWLRNLVVSGQPKEPRCLSFVYLAPWSSWELFLRGDLAWVNRNQGSPDLSEPL